MGALGVVLRPCLADHHTVGCWPRKQVRRVRSSAKGCISEAPCDANAKPSHAEERPMHRDTNMKSFPDDLHLHLISCVLTIINSCIENCDERRLRCQLPGTCVNCQTKAASDATAPLKLRRMTTETTTAAVTYITILDDICQPSVFLRIATLAA
jgi:hypothetical protein